MKRGLRLLPALLMISTLPALAHPGGLDASGCHHNRKTGDYHCHRAPTPPPASAASPSLDQPEVKMSRNNICHARGTRYYAQTTHFVAYSTVEACLAAGGRLPYR